MASIQSQTKAGAPVTLTPTEDRFGNPTVEVKVHHPEHGEVTFQSPHFGEPREKHLKGNFGILGHFYSGGKRIPALVTVPKEDFDRAMELASQISEQRTEDLKSGREKIRLRHHYGEPLSGHMTAGSHSREAKSLLKKLGLAKEISGWGTRVDPKVVEALGEEFTYEQAFELARPALEEEAQREEQRAQRRQEKFEKALKQAQETNQDVILHTTIDIDDDNFDATFVRPDGTTYVREYRSE